MEDEDQIITQQPQHSSPFDAIRQVDEHGHEYWSARKLSKILTYDDYRNFQKVMSKAIRSCESAGEEASDHFVEVTNMITVGKGAKRPRTDFHLTRHACYLVVENADPEKPVVALGQAYFAYQTRRQELSDEDALAGLTEDQRRLLIRGQLSLHNRQLAETAHSAGVVTSRDFAIFQDFGYKGLYGGLSAQDIHSRKVLHKGQKILDHMGSTELAANLFRSTQAEEQIRLQKIQEKEQANIVHHHVGEKVRQTIQELGGTMPENLPTPKKSIQQLQREEQKRLKQGTQESLFPLDELSQE
ncbi:DNA damage-inducible protein D [Ktedonobacteria bacterium brp13]|nr:DNA damage-inducible protein D [Ktedonobacteria bacterium brp13]